MAREKRIATASVSTGLAMTDDSKVSARKGGSGRKSTARKDDLTFVCYLILPDGTSVPWEETTEEQRQRFRERAAERLSRTMSAYYSRHPDEYARLPERKEA